MLVTRFHFERLYFLAMLMSSASAQSSVYRRQCSKCEEKIEKLAVEFGNYQAKTLKSLKNVYDGHYPCSISSNFVDHTNKQLVDMKVIDEEVVQTLDDNNTSADGILFVGDELEDSICALTTSSIAKNETSHWSCTLVSEDRTVYPAMVKVIGSDVLKQVSRATWEYPAMQCSTAASAFTVNHLWFFFLVMYQTCSAF